MSLTVSFSKFLFMLTRAQAAREMVEPSPFEGGGKGVMRRKYSTAEKQKKKNRRA